METATRAKHRVIEHFEFDSDMALLLVNYDVEGESRELVVWQPFDGRAAGDQAVIDALLEKCDEEAEWYAAHPDEMITARFECT